MALTLGACGEKASKPVPSPSSQHGKLPAVPKEFIGRWKLVGQECEADAEDLPREKHPDVIVRFGQDFRYELSVEGWRSVGRFRIDQMRDSPPTAQLEETMYEFDFVDGRLENWSEGEAVYQCGNIFRRDE
jgi:hypothetical protein